MEPTPRPSAMAQQLESGVAQPWEVLKLQPAFATGAATRSFSIGMSDDFELANGSKLPHLVQQQAHNASVIFRQTNRHAVERTLEGKNNEVAVVSGSEHPVWIEHEQIGDSGYAYVVDAKAIDVRLPLSLDGYVQLAHLLVSLSRCSGIADTASNAVRRRVGPCRIDAFLSRTGFPRWHAGSCHASDPCGISIYARVETHKPPRPTRCCSISGPVVVATR